MIIDEDTQHRKFRRVLKNAIQKDEENMPLKKEIIDPRETR